MGTYVPERGYHLGPVLPVGKAPWELGWAQAAALEKECLHQWERVVVRFKGSHPDEPVVRCSLCHAPRCGDSNDHDPCMEVRHHVTLHIYLSGRFEPVGGSLAADGS